MTQHSSQSAVIEGLNKGLFLPPEGREVLRRQGLLAKSTDLRFLRTLCHSSYCLHAVRYENETGQQREALCFARQDESGLWYLQNVVFESEEHLVSREEQDTSQPWVLLSGAAGGHPFWAGGPVIDHSFHVRRVLLITSNGVMLEDYVEENLVLFLTDKQVQLPIEAQLYDRSDTLVGRQTVFDTSSPT